MMAVFWIILIESDNMIFQNKAKPSTDILNSVIYFIDSYDGQSSSSAPRRREDDAAHLVYAHKILCLFPLENGWVECSEK